MTQLDQSSLKPEDFDGHTDFAELSPEQKLAWLAAIVQLAYEVRQSREESSRSTS